jgi:anti-sigma factor RsiW
MTNPDHGEFADWDAAYVLGALSPSDRRRFETHLQDCEACHDAIVEIAPTIGLLSRIAPDHAASLLDPPTEEGPSEARKGDVIAIGVRQSRRRRAAWWTGGLAAAAAIVVAVVLAATLAIAPAMRNVQVVALQPVGALPITATVELSNVAWGTRIEMICRYTDADEANWPAGGRPYSLNIQAKDGTWSEVSSWLAYPGATARLGAGTALNPDQIKAIEIRSVSSGRVLMHTDLARPGGSSD